MAKCSNRHGAPILVGPVHSRHTIPNHTVPYHTVPYHTAPYHTIPNHTIPYHTIHTIPYRMIPYHTIPYHTIPYHNVPYHTLSYHTIPYHTIPYHTIPYHTIPYHFNFSTLSSCLYPIPYAGGLHSASTTTRTGGGRQAGTKTKNIKGPLQGKQSFRISGFKVFPVRLLWPDHVNHGPHSKVPDCSGKRPDAAARGTHIGGMWEGVDGGVNGGAGVWCYRSWYTF